MSMKSASYAGPCESVTWYWIVVHPTPAQTMKTESSAQAKLSKCDMYGGLASDTHAPWPLLERK